MAETPDLSIAQSLNFTQNAFRSSNFQYQTVQSNQYGSPILINTSITPVMFNMPTVPFNLSQTYASFNVNIPQPPAGYYVWTFADCIPEIKQIQFFGPNQMLLADLDNANVYSKFVIPREMAFEDYMSNDQMNKIYPCNSLNNVVPALRNGNSFVGGVELNANPAYKNYTEQAHFNVGPINNAGLLNNVLTYQVQLPLSVYKNTLFAVNKTLYFEQITYVKIFFANIARVCYMSTSNANPSAGAPIAWAPIAGAVTPYDNVNITNLQLYVACETNPSEIAMITKQVQESSIDMLIPWVQMFNNSNTGSSQSINIQIDSGLGLYIVKIYHSIFSTDPAVEMAYDNSNNCPGLGSNQSYKFLNGYTQWNGARLQPIQIDCTAGNNTDYLMQRGSLKGSVLDSLSQYEYSWHWLDDFSGLSPDYVQGSKDDLISGKKLDAVPKTWQFVGTVMRAAIGQAQATTPGSTANVAERNSFSHYTFVCTMKHLTISRGQILLE